MMTNNLTKEKIKCIVLSTIVVTILIFATIFLIMVSDDQFTIEKTEKALSLTAGYFGGIATLSAAIIAFNLYTDWKTAIKYPKQLDQIATIALKLYQIRESINSIRANQETAKILTDLFSFLLTNKLNNNLRTYDQPNFTEINNHIQEIQENIAVLDIYSPKGLTLSSYYPDDLPNGFDQYHSSLKDWIALFERLGGIITNPHILTNLNEKEIQDYLYLFCDCCSEFYEINMVKLGDYSIYSHNEIDIFYNEMYVRGGLYNYQIALENL